MEPKPKIQTWMTSLIGSIAKTLGIPKLLVKPPPELPKTTLTARPCQCAACRIAGFQLVMDLAFLEVARRRIIRRLQECPPAPKETIRSEILVRIATESEKFALN